MGEQSTESAINESTTPGAWMRSSFDPQSPIIVVGTSGEWVCKVSSEKCWAAQSREREWANAALIAAAPDLLAACKDILPDLWWEDDKCPKMLPGVDPASVRALRAAILKAEGVTK